MLLMALFAGMLDLNTATPEQLRELPGIGRKKAEAIVELRQRRPFRRTTELLRVRGIGEKLYGRVRNDVCAGASCTTSAAAGVPVAR